MVRPVDVYLAARSDLVPLIADLDPSMAVPATPAWSVHDVLAHLVGLCHDLVDGNVADYAGPEWTAAQVATWRDRPVATLLDDWTSVLPSFLAAVDDPTAHGLEEYLGIAPVVDLVSHTFDVRDAAGCPAPADLPAWELIGPRREFLLSVQVATARLPALSVHTPEGDEWVVGDGAPVGAVTAPRSDLWRSLEGRRTRAAVRAFDWTVDPEPYLPVWPGRTFRWPDDGA